MTATITPASTHTHFSKPHGNEGHVTFRIETARRFYARRTALTVALVGSHAAVAACAWLVR